MTTLDPRGLEEAARVAQFLGGGQPSRRDLSASPLRYARCSSDAAIVVRAYLDVAQPVVETVQALKDLPVGVVVRSAAGTIAWRADECNGVVFGDDRPFPWTSLMLPARVIHWGTP